MYVNIERTRRIGPKRYPFGVVKQLIKGGVYKEKGQVYAVKMQSDSRSK
jgi:hypothetical protein